jgi:oligogalacturonide lyase
MSVKISSTKRILGDKHMRTNTSLNVGVIIFAMMLFTVSVSASNVGRRFPSEKKTFEDKVTGLTVTALTTNPANDSKIYQTHPQWTSDGEYIIFRSDRAGRNETPGQEQGMSSRRTGAARGRSQAFAVHEESGEIIQLSDGPTGTGSLNISRKSNKLYFMQGGSGQPRQLIELNLDPLFADSKAGTIKDPNSYERVVAIIPAEMRESGGFTLDADETKAYMGIAGEDRDRGGIRSIDLQTGEITKVIDVDFRMGHVQSNYWVPGEIIYCHETGGDAPTRIWFCKADGSVNEPLYVETPDEWVTHEVCVDADHVIFNVMAHLPRLRKKPTGIFCINLRTREIQVLGQVQEGRGFWHSAGSSDGQWAVGDNFDGSVYLVNRKNGRKHLLTTGHIMRPDHTHPNFSPDNKRILIQSGLLSNGQSLDLMVVEIPAEWADS